MFWLLPTLGFEFWALKELWIRSWLWRNHVGWVLIVCQSFTTAGQGEEEALSQTGSQKSGEIVIDEEAGIAETVARWQQRKRERLELERRRLREEGSSAKIQGKGHIHGEGEEGEGIRQASSAQEPKLEVTELPGTIASDIHPVKSEHTNLKPKSDEICTARLPSIFVQRSYSARRCERLWGCLF